MIGGTRTNVSFTRVSRYLLDYLHAETDATWLIGPTRVGTSYPVLDESGEASCYLCVNTDGESTRYDDIGHAVAASLAAIGGAESRRPAPTEPTNRLPVLEDEFTQGRVVAYFQPIVALRTGEIVAIEALARWQTPDGVLGTSAFIENFNNGPVMMALFDRMLEAALQFLADHRVTMPDLAATVNLELAAVPADGLVSLVASRLQEFDIPPDSLTIELNERLAYDLSSGALDQLRRLAESGVKLLVDDLSATFDAIQRMPGVPIAGAKLDRRYVNQLTAGDHETAVVRGVLERAAAAGIEVIAEGVETQVQCDRLVRLGCHFGQGYLFAVAQPAGSLAAVLEASLATTW
jgi:EAL domain-containing protein (putative c-di-GMP-specific phosphodiesterase class I)